MNGTTQVSKLESTQPIRKNKSVDRRWLSALIITLLSLPTSLVLAPNSWSQGKTNQTESGKVKKLEIKENLANIEFLSKQADAGQITPISPQVIDQLVDALKDPSTEVRRRAVDALTGIGTGAEEGVPPLVEILEDRKQPADLRRNAIVAIRSIYAGLAVDPLIKALDDSDPGVRSNAALALGSIEKAAIDAVPKLIGLIENDDYEEIRGNAAEVIAKIDPKNQKVWSTLNEALDDPSWRVRRKSADALAVIGKAGAKEAVPNLLTALENKNSTLRTSAAKTLGLLGSESQKAVPDLQEALKKNDNDFAQAAAAEALGNIGADDSTTLEALIEALSDSDSIVREKAFDAFYKIAIALTDKLMEKPEIKPDELQQTIERFETALKQMTLPNSGFSDEQSKKLKPSLNRLQAKQAQKAFINIILQNPWVWGVIAYIALHLGLFWLRPLWLLKIDELLKPISFKVPILGMEISPRFLLFLKFDSRVLDAWVAAHIESVREEFQKIENVEARKVYIPTPAILDSSEEPQIITSQNLRDKIDKPLLIWGEGGVGKTSLSFQIAQWAMAEKENERMSQHRMLPILIGKDLKCQGEDRMKSLLDAISGQLKNLTKKEEPISEELLERLLRRRRILVIVDHLSEMNEQTQETIDPENSDFPINALIVTSRQKETLSQSSKTTINPLHIEGTNLVNFMQKYLEKKDKQNLFTGSGDEFITACSRLSRMVGQNKATAMLATLFTDQLIKAKEKAAQNTSVTVSDNIPALMIAYLNQLNRDLTHSKSDGDKFDDHTVRQDAKIVAWACVQENYHSLKIARETALEALKAARGEKAEDHLQYLEERLHLIQTIEDNEDQICFSLELLAQYLAALHLIDLYKRDESQWLAFLEQSRAKSDNPAAISNFLGVVKDCLKAKNKEANIYSLILTKLDNLTEPVQIQNKNTQTMTFVNTLTVAT